MSRHQTRVRRPDKTTTFRQHPFIRTVFPLACPATPARSRSKDALRMLQISRSAYAGQGEVEAVLILVADGTQCQPAILDAKPATVPVVRGLDAAILQGILNKVVAG